MIPEIDFYPAYLLTATRIPIDFDEWFFIVATYDPDIDEDVSFEFENTYSPDAVNTLKYFSEFWQGHVLPEAQEPTDNQISAGMASDPPDNLSDEMIGKYTPRSGYGNRCKVEFLSKNALLRAKGFKSEFPEASGNASDTSQTVGG